MILGIGNDLVDIRRIETAVERFGQRFLDRIYTADEQAKAARRQGAPQSYHGTLAKRFAAKEAASKALGSGFRDGVFWRDLRVINLPSGQPTMAFTGGAAERLVRITPPGMRAVCHLTMTDEWPLAEAMVILSAVPDGGDGA